MPLGPGDLVFSAGTHLVTPFLDRLAPARAAGFAGVSVYPYEIEALRQGGTSDASVRHRVADHGLCIGELDAITTWIPGHTPPDSFPAALTEMLLTNTPERLCPMAEAVGGRSLTVVEFYGGHPSVESAAAAFAAACDVAARHGVLLHLEFLPWAGIPDLATAAEIVRLADRPNGGLLVDTWHFFRSRSTLDQLRTIPGDRILYVQLADMPAVAEPDLAEETQHRRLLPGEGAADLTAFLGVIDHLDCPAPFGVEVFSDALAAQPIDVVTQQASAAARTLLGAAGTFGPGNPGARNPGSS